MARIPKTHATPAQQAEAEARLRKAVEAAKARPPATEQYSSLGIYLQECETGLIQLMNGQEPTPAPGVDIGYGLVLYWIEQKLSDWEWELLRFPRTQITTAEYDGWLNSIEDGGIVAWDGSLIGTGTWEAFDPGWLISGMSYLAVDKGVIQPAPFGTTPATVTVTQSKVRIVLVGDWGTGIWTDGSLTCPSQAVMAQIKNLNPAPDYVIHLGDVYYAGLENIGPISSEETDNFEKLWPSQFAGKSFTCNSNHEMYSGALGYFNDVLNASGTPFSLQQGTSYFALQGPSSSSPKWAVVGLDSAYYDTSALYMLGSIDPTQLAFLAGFNSVPLLIVLCHHNGITTDGTQVNDPLFSQVQGQLGSTQTVMWYWGHEHNGIVYSANAASGSILARCVGHGAIPFGNGPGLAQKMNPPPGGTATIDYYAHTPLTGGDPEQANRVLNGFAMIDLVNNSNGTSVTETFVDQDGNTAWTNQLNVSN